MNIFDNSIRDGVPQRTRATASKPQDIADWEDEGGALPESPDNAPAPPASQDGPTADLAETLTGDACPEFRNDGAVPEIRVGTKVFICIGVSPPDDHPHVYLNMGSESAILCPYCATAFHYDPELGPFDCVPAESLYSDPDAA